MGWPGRLPKLLLATCLTLELVTAGCAQPRATRSPEAPSPASIAQSLLTPLPDPFPERLAPSSAVRRVVALSQSAPATKDLPPPRKLKAEPVTLHLDDTDVRKALEILSREGKLNIMIAPGVTGRVTGNLKNLSPDEALDAIARLANLIVQRQGGLVYVYSAEELGRTLGRDPRLCTRVYHLNYVRAGDVAQMIRPLLTKVGKVTTTPASEVGIGSSTGGASGTPPPGGGSGGASATPPAPGLPGPGGGGASGGGGGRLTTGGNSLAGGEVIVVQDQEAVLHEVDRIVAELDVPPRQVLIEAVILRVTLDKSRQISANFGLVDPGRHILNVTGSGALLNAATAFDPLRVLNPDGTVRGNPAQGFAENVPGLKFGFVGRDVSGFIRALETTQKLEVLARPRLLVLNKQRAQLLLGQRLGYTTVSQNLVSVVQQVQFLNVGTQLRVRPFISSDGMIRMEINPERSTGQIVNNVPQTDTSEVTTNVMVPNGTTLVIGGLIEHINDRRQEGIPILSDLPWVGALFRDRTHNNTRNELVVLLTPHIWDPTGHAGAPPPAVPAPLPRLTCTVQASAEAIPTGQDVIYRILVANRGPVPAEGITVNVEVTPGLDPLQSDGPATGLRLDKSRVAFHAFPRLPPQTQEVYTVRVRAAAPGEQHFRARVNSLSLTDAVQAEALTRVLPPEIPSVAPATLIRLRPVPAPH